MAECAICARTIPDRWWVCQECRDVWELRRPFANWPEWAKELKAQEQRYRIGDALESVSLADLDAPLESLSRPPRLRTRPDDDMVDGLPLDPYDDPELNRQYRKANYF